MANPTKLTLYVASTTRGGGITTVLKSKVVLSKKVEDTLNEFAPYLRDNLVKPKDEHRYEGNVKLPASLDEATIQLIDVISPAIAFLNEMYNHVTLEVMFNEPTINTAIKQGYLDKWRANRFEYKMVGRKKEIIPHSGRWYAFDVLLRQLEGNVVWYNGDETMNELVESLKPKLRRNQYDIAADAVTPGD